MVVRGRGAGLGLPESGKEASLEMSHAERGWDLGGEEQSWGKVRVQGSRRRMGKCLRNCKGSEKVPWRRPGAVPSRLQRIT